MSANPLKAMGRWRAGEGVVEITAPVLAVGAGWAVAYAYLSRPAVGRGATWIELAVLLGACCALTGWMAGRQLYMGGRRNPWTIVLISEIYAGIIVWAVSGMVASAFTTQCTDLLLGQVVPSTMMIGRSAWDVVPAGPDVCKVGGVTDNPYLPGTLFRPTWDGSLHPLLVVWLAIITPLSALGMRERRLFGTRIGDKLIEMLRYAPAKGAASSKGGVGENGVLACSNATLWGELCGQLYSSDHPFQPGEWCHRCHQIFKPCKRELRFKVVSLFGDQIDVLNGLERVDTLAWSHGEPIPPDARISGEERWVHMGDIVVPDVITVAQMLALTHDKIALWAKSENPRIAGAATVAKKRASRIAGWIWFGTLSHRLTYARPTSGALLVLGSTRLRDVVTEAGEELWLQVDIGFLPLEVRLGYRKEIDAGVMLENNKIDVWIPTSPPRAPKNAQGVWVPRIEGEALRLWLSTDRLREGRPEGVSEPTPYFSYEGAEGQAPKDRRVKPGNFDFVRTPLGGQGREPTMEIWPGASVSEWDWMEAPQIQLLRQQCVVLVEGER